jgi:threonine dehydrogenase-like Zn-dependent dehydrogenase
VTVVGGGMVGCCVARLLAGYPAVDVTLVDVDDSRAQIAAAIGVRFARPSDALGEQDLVVHASATAAGLNRALQLVRDEGTVLELSWYGDAPTPVALGADFHRRRLVLRASQVGRVAPRRRDSRSTRDRLTLSLDLLRDPAFDALLTGTSPFEALPDLLRELTDGGRAGLCHVITYPGGEPCSA